MKKLINLIVMIVGLLAVSVGFAANQQRAGLLVFDYSGNVEPEDYKEMRTVTRWAYHFPNYVLLEGKDVAVARSVLDKRKIDRQELAQAAETNNLDALVLVRIYDFLEMIDTTRGYSFENGPVVKVEARGDLIVYRRDSGKVLMKKINEREFYDMGNQKSPKDIFKWKLCDLVNTMEGRELIR